MIYTNVAIIGSNGFIGSHLTQKIRNLKNVNVFLFGKKEVSVFGEELPYTRLSLTDEQQIKDNFRNIDLVYYLASETIPASSWDNPHLEVEKNLLPFLTFMDNIVKLNVKKIVFISSGGTIYGATKEKATEDSVKNPFSPHGIIKLTMEYFLNYYHKKNNISFDIFRVSNVYGIGQNTKKGLGIINSFLEKIISEHKITVFGNGNQVRNYIYADDLAELLTLSLHTDPQTSEIYNVCSNDTLTINELIQKIKAVLKEDFTVLNAETRQSDYPAIYLDNAKILKAFKGFNFTPMEQGILKTYQHIKDAATVESRG